MSRTYTQISMSLLPEEREQWAKTWKAQGYSDQISWVRDVLGRDLGESNIEKAYQLVDLARERLAAVADTNFHAEKALKKMEEIADELFLAYREEGGGDE